MNMKTFFSTLFLVFSPSISFAAPDSVPCEVDYVYCLSEFIDASQQGKSIEEMISRLPVHVRQNLTFKRGNNIEKTINRKSTIVGPHGHLAPTNESSSATPDQPRAFVWDEKSGFTASWNSGNPGHTANDRIDLYDFDFAKKEHRLFGWTAKDGMLDANTADTNGRTCITCHGQVQRPIFPMYPDWPQFYGEFNDEMAGYPAGMNALRPDLRILGNEFQPKDRRFYNAFLADQAVDNPRYSALFDVKPARANTNLFYPYRPRNTTSPTSDISRAFANRPNLRIGVMYNRLTALQVFEHLKASPVFKKFPDIMFYSLMDCNWNFSTASSGLTERTRILDALTQGAAQIDSRFANINLRGVAFTEADLADLSTAAKSAYKAVDVNGQRLYYRHNNYNTAGYQQVPYEDILKLLDLDLRNLDIRFRHDASVNVLAGVDTATKKAVRFNIYDPKAFHFTKSVMDIGYLEDRYDLNPICNDSNRKAFPNGRACNFSYDNTYMQGMRYFNSYFDGSATMNELLAAQILIYLTDANQDFSNEPDLAAVRTILRRSIPNPNIYFETLMKKYSNKTDRLVLDKTFFTRMDILSPWLQLPYSPDLIDIHNRESFWTRDSAPIRLRHAQWTDANARARNVVNRNGGNNICWNVYDSMKARYLK